MPRPRFLAPIGILAATLAVGPALAAVALAAEPTVLVRPGDTLTGISKRHGVSIADLVRLNGITNPDRIYAGQSLRIGTDPAAPQASAAPPPAAAPATATVHVVQRGENLTAIARRYGTTIAAFAAANGLANPSRIYAGQQLVVPGLAPSPVAAPTPVAPAPAPVVPPTVPAPPPPAAAPAPATVHVVQRGENLTAIARRYGTTIAAIAAANGLADPSRIWAGQPLTIPGAAPPAAAPAPPPAMPSSMASRVAARDAVRQVIVEEASALGVPAALALALAWQESGWQQGVVSSAGAVGVMQLLPATADWVAQAMLGAPVDVTDTRQNVRAGVRLLGHYLARYGGDRELALAAYYQGQRAADRYGVYQSTRPYIASILLLERIFGG